MEERKAAETELKTTDSKDPFAYLDLDSKRLSEYYAIDQEQARSSFRWAVFVMLLGLGTVLTGLWIFYFRESTKDTFLASLTAGAGLLSNFISATFLYLHGQVKQRSIVYYGQLTRLQLLGVTIRLAESHDDAAKKAAAKDRVIDQVLTILKDSVAAMKPNVA